MCKGYFQVHLSFMILKAVCIFKFIQMITYRHIQNWLYIHIILPKEKIKFLNQIVYLIYWFWKKKNHFTFVTNVKPQSTFNKYKAVLLTLAWSFPFLTSLKICCWKLLVFLQSPETQQIFPKYLGWQKSQNKTQTLLHRTGKNATSTSTALSLHHWD